MWLPVGEGYAQFVVAVWAYMHALWLVLVDALHLGNAQDVEQTAININLSVAIKVVGVGQRGAVSNACLCHNVAYFFGC